MKKSEAEKIALKSAWLSRQGPALQRALMQRSTLSFFNKDDSLCDAADPKGAVHMAASGRFGFDVGVPHANPCLAHIAHPGAWFGTRPISPKQPNLISVRALERSHVLSIPMPAIHEIAVEEPTVFQCIAALSDAQVVSGATAISDLLLRRSHQRVAAILLRISRATLNRDMPRLDVVRATQQDLADMANVSRDGVNRILKRFQAKGAIAVSHSRVKILNTERLFAYVKAKTF